MRISHSFLLLLVAVSCILVSCSKHDGNSGTPTDSPLVPSSIAENQGYDDWGNYTLNLDIENQKVELLENREANIHYNVTPYLTGGGMAVSFVSWDPATYELQLEFALTNPTSFDVSDVRLIFTDFVWITYPQRLLEWDGWTTALTGQARPFLAYKKADPNRVLYGHDTETLTAHIYWPPGSPFQLNFKVTAWLWLHCNDPYQITNMAQSGYIFQDYGSTKISCKVKDWQDDVSHVYAYTEILTGSGWQEMTKSGASWVLTFENTLNRDPGLYQIWIKAQSPNPQGYETMDYFFLQVYQYGWHQSLTYAHTYNGGSTDIGCYSDVDSIDTVNVLRAKGTGYPEMWRSQGVGSSPAVYKSLADLDPNYTTYQPWPPERVDAAADGAFGWTNANPVIWYSFYQNADTFSMMRKSLIFGYEPLTADNRILFYQGGTENALHVFDVCDTFEGRLCEIVGFDGTMDILGIAIVNGPIAGRYSYFDDDMELVNNFPAAMIGVGAGKVNMGKISGIDIMETAISGEYVGFIAEKDYREIEVVKLVKGDQYLTSIGTINVSYSIGAPKPLDIELLPASPDYAPHPNTNILCVLVDRMDINGALGSLVLLYSADSLNYLGSLGTHVSPFATFTPYNLDTDDNTYSVVVSQRYSTYLMLNQRTYYAAP